MNCNVCNKWIKHPKNWIRHCKTKGHIKREMENNQQQPETPDNTPNNTPNVNNTPNNTPNTINNTPNTINNTPKRPQKDTINTPNNTINTQNNTQENEKEYYGYCKYCNKGLKYQQGLSRHQKKCKHRQQEQEQQATTIINNIDNTTNNTQVINQIVVQISVRGQEDFSKCITIESLEELRALTGAELLTTVATQFFGSAENKSIACPNIKNDFGIVKRIEGPRTEYIPPVLKDVIDRLPEDLRHTMKSMIDMARENGYYKQKNRYAIDDKRLVMEIYNEMIKACHNPKERKIVEKSLKALFHNNKLLTKEAKECI